MTRQYIGARYVPRFYEGSSGTDWTANTQYEPLTIVTRNGNSYTSKKPVPASVGAPESNPNYWASTGIYNAQVEQLQEDIENVADDLDEYKDTVNTQFETIKKKRLVVFGDSWADTEHTTYTKWPAILDSGVIDLLANYAKNGATITGSDVYGENGTVGGQIAHAATDASYDKNDVTDIIVMGGVNDLRGGRTPAEVSNAYVTLVSRIRAMYPSARIVLLVNYQIYVTVEALRYYAFLVRNVRTAGCEAWHMLGWISPGEFIDDKIHPNNNGYKKILSNVMAVLFGGAPVRFEHHTSYSYTTDNGVTVSLEINEFFTDDGYAAFPAITVSGADSPGSTAFTDSTFKQSCCAFLDMIGNRYTNTISNLTRAIVIQTYGTVDSSGRGTQIKFEIGYEGNGTFIGPVVKRIAQ